MSSLIVVLLAAHYSKSSFMNSIVSYKSSIKSFSLLKSTLLFAVGEPERYWALAAAAWMSARYGFDMLMPEE